VRATVDPRGVETTYYMQYGATAAYGAQTPPLVVGSGTQEVRVTQSILGLQANTTYHYRTIASSAAGTIMGEDRVFTTKKIPLAITIAATSHTDVFGEPFTISGALSGSESADHAVVLQTNPFPYLNGFKDVEAVELTNSTGGFSFTYRGLLQNTEFRVAALDTPPTPTTDTSPVLATPTVLSPGFIELLAVRVTLHAHATARAGFMRLDGTVGPAQPGATVSIQRLRDGHKPEWVGKAPIKHLASNLSRFSTTVRIAHPGLYRASVQVLSGRQVSHYSSSIRIR